MTVHLDYETYSACDIKKCGAYRYAFDASTEILMIGLAVDDGEPVLWLPGQSKYDVANMKADVALEKLADPDTIIVAHNAQFEIAITDALFTKTTGFPAPKHHQWRCTAAMARRAALPASLAKCAEALKLPQQKDTKGMSLIRKFCVPQKPKARSKKVFRPRIYPHDEPEAFYQFGQYCLQDVRTEQAIGRALKPFELKGFALDTFLLDLEINARGLPVNLAGLRNALKLVNEVTADVGRQFKELTGLDHTQSAKFLAWLKSHGYTGDDLRAETLEDQLEEMEFADDSLVGRALKLRQQVSFAAVKKIPAMLACAGPHDNRVRGTLIWHGAGPGRRSGTLIQPQNFKRPDAALVAKMPHKDLGFASSDDALDWLTQEAYRDICRGAGREYIELTYGPPLSVLSSVVRHFIHDTERGPMLDADYSAIEACIMAWLAGEEWRLEVFRTHGKIYEASACRMFGMTMDQVTKPIRQKAKIAELALQYQGSVGAMLAMGALKMGLTEDELPGIVSAWREANPNIKKYWSVCERAAKAAVINPGSRHDAGKVTYFCRDVAGMKYLFAKLPSGRNIAYPDPKIEKQLRYEYQGKYVNVFNPVAGDIAKAIKRVGEGGYYIKDSLTVFGSIPMRSVLGRFGVSPGTLAENQCQGIAADVLDVGTINLERGGYQVATLIHDEAVCAMLPGQTSEEMCRLMTTMPAWAAGLPLKAAGGIINFYKK